MKTFTVASVLAIFGCALAVPAAGGNIVSSTQITSSNQTFYFTGTCTDCNQSSRLPATATLVLSGNYQLGTSILLSQFVSFTYNGTDLVSPFSINSSNVTYLNGTIPASLPGFANFDIIKSGSIEFITSLSGNWSVCTTGCGDFGTNGAFAATSTPEPATQGLLALGLAVVGLAARRRRV